MRVNGVTVRELIDCVLRKTVIDTATGAVPGVCVSPLLREHRNGTIIGSNIVNSSSSGKRIRKRTVS